MANTNVKYILEHKDVVQSHIENHKSTWASLPTNNSHAISENPIKVFVRVRPLLPADLKAGSFSLAEVQESKLVHITYPTVRWAGGRIATKTYEADAIFSNSATNQDVFNGMDIPAELRQMLDQDGRELSILAYGQTGTGKTHTTTSLEEQIGSHIFNIASEGSTPSITISALEIRGSLAYDLLSEPALQPVKISVASSTSKFQGLSTHTVSSNADLQYMIKKGRELRLTRSTSKNDTSSRSHSIMTINVVHHKDGQKDVSSTVNIVDLAGSERSSIISNNTPERAKESIETNKSLAALKDCIRARLSEKPVHTPWRSDKLTMALKGSFEERRSSSGDSQPPRKLFVIACISPSVLDVEDSLNTLKYVTPFQLSARGAVDATVRQNDIASADNPLEWDHDKSKGYIIRYMPKITALVDRLLPTPTSTLASLIPLGVDALEQLCSTPSPNEGKHRPVPDRRVLNAARVWLPTYHKKLQSLAVSSSDANQPNGRTRKAIPAGMVSTGRPVRKGDPLAALNGRDPTANETGFVRRITDLKGTSWDAIERLEVANQ